MTLHIFINGQRLDPARAVRDARPLDTMLVCPACNGGHVDARDAKTVEQIVGDSRLIISSLEHKQFVPRLQDRRCLDCGHRWQCVLPPTSYTDGITR